VCVTGAMDDVFDYVGSIFGADSDPRLPDKHPRKKTQNTPRRSDWAPGLLARTLIFGLGYAVRDDIRYSDDGIRVAAFVCLTAIVNEFFLEYIAMRRATVGPSYLQWRIERLLVLIRFFTITAVASTVTEIMRDTFHPGSDVSSIVLSLLIIFVISESVARDW